MQGKSEASSAILLLCVTRSGRFNVRRDHEAMCQNALCLIADDASLGFVPFPRADERSR